MTQILTLSSTMLCKVPKTGLDTKNYCTINLAFHLIAKTKQISNKKKCPSDVLIMEFS